MSDTQHGGWGSNAATPAPPAAQPLNDRLGAALARLESLVNNTQTVLNKLRQPGPEVEPAIENKSPYQSHEIMDQLELRLDHTANNVDRINSLI